MKPRSAIKNDLFPAEHRRDKIDRLGDPLAEIGLHLLFWEAGRCVFKSAGFGILVAGGAVGFAFHLRSLPVVLCNVLMLLDPVRGFSDS